MKVSKKSSHVTKTSLSPAELCNWCLVTCSIVQVTGTDWRQRTCPNVFHKRLAVILGHYGDQKRLGSITYRGSDEANGHN
ncbi:hypothetical protein RRG08_035112 [Elysia crispata]|uniref:Uncharacterized protein n=1 Tax=Elysia crispata TaxID=231223 RepID=A0AAE0ZTL0_9GAST|nr:hypothetical protein RRG08_035111 [Elysia crispata]KAK3774686.1 hypothetical protein RRG08_035112 [Elysia crispata]